MEKSSIPSTDQTYKPRHFDISLFTDMAMRIKKDLRDISNSAMATASPDESDEAKRLAVEQIEDKEISWALSLFVVEPPTTDANIAQDFGTVLHPAEQHIYSFRERIGRNTLESLRFAKKVAIAGGKGTNDLGDKRNLPIEAFKNLSTSCSENPSTIITPRDQDQMGSEVVFRISLYSMARPKIPLQTIFALGSNSIKQLRDKIYCFTDLAAAYLQSYGSSPRSLEELNQQRANLCPYRSNAILWIENVVYEDVCTEPTYSRQMLDWLSANDPSGALPTCVSSECLLKDLTPFRLGYPYMFLHNGVCEHYIVFEEVRLYHQSTDSRTTFPYESFRHSFRRKKCAVCDSSMVRWVTVEDELASVSPCGFCNSCYEAMHCLPDGSLAYQDFKVFPYFHE